MNLPEAPVVSIIICTRNRAQHLKATLESLNRVRVPSDLSAEVIVVDNGSSDETGAIVKDTKLRDFALRYSVEPRPGQSNARNRGLGIARGRAILFTDDDVRPPGEWLTG